MPEENKKPEIPKSKAVIKITIKGIPNQDTEQEKIWDSISSELFTPIKKIKKTIKDYSYLDKESSIITDEKVCSFMTKELSKSKKLLYSISDILFSLHVASNLLPISQVMRDEVDIFSDEIKIRSLRWNTLSKEFMKKIIRQDLILIENIKQTNKKLDVIFRGILKHKQTEKFWKQVEDALEKVRSDIHNMAVLFKEREVICNINPITLERTFKSLQKEIRENV